MPVIPVMPAYPPIAPARPGAVSAVGVISIIVAALGMIMGIVTAGFAVTAVVTAMAQRVTASQHDAVRYPLIPEAQLSAPDAVDDQRAGMIVDAFTRTRPLTPTRQKHVRSLARMHGKQLFSFDVKNVTVLRAKSNITDSGPVLLSQGKTGDFYITGAGRLEVSDASAIFRPDNGQAVRSGDVAVDRSLSEPDIANVLSDIESRGSLTINPAPRATVLRLLRDPDQSIIGSPTSVQYAGGLSGAGLWFVTDKSQVRLTAAGTETLLSLNAPIPGTNPLSGRPIRTIWSQLLLLEAGASTLLAVLLLIGGIFLLRGRPVGRKLITIWSLIKLPITVAGAAILGFTVFEWVAVFQAQSAATPPPAGVWAWSTALTIGVGAILWPIIALVVLNRQSVKAYFSDVV